MQKSIAEHSMGDGVARNVAAPVPDGRDHMSGFGLVGCTAHWRGRQWAVTDTGVEALNGKYHTANIILQSPISGPIATGGTGSNTCSTTTGLISETSKKP